MCKRFFIFLLFISFNKKVCVMSTIENSRKRSIRFHSVTPSPSSYLSKSKESSKETLYDPTFKYLSKVEATGLTSPQQFSPLINYHQIFSELESEVNGEDVETGFARLSLPAKFLPKVKGTPHKSSTFMFGEMTRFSKYTQSPYITTLVSDKFGKELPAFRCSKLQLKKKETSNVFIGTQVSVQPKDLITFGIFQSKERMRGILIYTCDSCQEWPEDHPSVSPLIGKNVGLINARLVYIRVSKFSSHREGSDKNLEWIDPTYLLVEGNINEEPNVLLEDGTLDLEYIRTNIDSPEFSEVKKILDGFDLLTLQVEERLKKRETYSIRTLLPYRQIIAYSKARLTPTTDKDVQFVHARAFISSLLEIINDIQQDEESKVYEVPFSAIYTYNENGKSPIELKVILDGDRGGLYTTLSESELGLLNLPQTRELLENKGVEKFCNELKEKKEKTLSLSFKL